MTRAYRALLRLFPQDYQTFFGAEMIATFDRASEERRALNRFGYIRFAAAELAGLAMSAPLEWIAKMTTSESVRGRAVPDLRRMRPAGMPRELWFSQASRCNRVPDEIVEAQRHVDLCLRRMEHAIATHDFPGARHYSNEDLKAREHLHRLRAQYGLGE